MSFSNQELFAFSLCAFSFKVTNPTEFSATAATATWSDHVVFFRFTLSLKIPPIIAIHPHVLLVLVTSNPNNPTRLDQVTINNIFTYLFTSAHNNNSRTKNRARLNLVLHIASDRMPKYVNESYNI